MASARSSDRAVAVPSAEEVQNQLERILASESVRLPERARSFLRYVVTETLAGRSHYLKAYTIAQVVFGRKDFDAQSDPAVRIEAGRIRRELERYYLMANPGEPVVITIPKGGYVPIFEASSDCRGDSADEATAAPSAVPPESSVGPATPLRVVPNPGSPPWLIAAAITAVAIATGAIFFGLKSPSKAVAVINSRPTIAVNRFADIADESKSLGISNGVTDEVISKLVKFKEILVVDASDHEQDSAQGFQNARYVLQGSVRQNSDLIRTTARLVRRSDGAVIWANHYDSDLRIQSVFEVETGLAEEIATAVAQPFGVVFQADIAPDTKGGWDAYDCSLSYYSYRRSMTAEALATAQQCLRAVTEKFPGDATSLAFLSLTYLDQVRFPYKLGTKPSPKTLETASELAKKSAAIEPQNPRVLQALMLTNFFRNDVNAALEAGAAAYQLNPNDAEVAGEYGLRLSMAGKWDTGCDLISKAISKNAGPPGYYEVGMALCAFMRGDLQAAELWSRMSDLNYNPMHRMVLASILGASGKIDQAKRELEWLDAKAPALMPMVKREISTRLARPEDQERVLAGLRAAGAAVDRVQPTVIN
ncbi:TolB-like protein [Rhizobium mesoamericanum]|uniref:hypothetical protein n=1 Tax=Rhizobium mesoamericanum TaxID=1079800 RepID=UPI00278AA8B0|nr:hypothetical protein [Rhizobium mesoamericanum]MDQ0559054.1 TolB-like protein [Rhizobium mesoamericanum]